ncbi:MAG: hypothetical protein SGI90_07010 [Candidatus Eisenbacteria bacterium]|nr:hypothetical protein [Candidatus Eisenbacteria bacterium]
MTIRRVLAAALVLLGAAGIGRAANVTAPDYGSKFWTRWSDGRADVDGYELVTPRYGAPRKGTAVLIMVTENFAEKERVKSDPGRRPAGEEFPVIKLNRVEDFSTGIYDYNLMTSVFVALTRAAGLGVGLPTKVSFSAQDWCGHVYSQALFDSATVRLTSHSYFDGEADESAQVDGAEIFSEDALPLWARGLAGPRVVAGKPVTVSMLMSLKAARLGHVKPVLLSAILSEEPGYWPSRVPGGTFTIRTRTAELSDGRSWTFEVEAAEPHRLIRWTGSNGEVGRWLGGDRLAYWQLNEPGGEAMLSRLGLSARPPRTP